MRTQRLCRQAPPWLVAETAEPEERPCSELLDRCLSGAFACDAAGDFRPDRCDRGFDSGYAFAGYGGDYGSSSSWSYGCAACCG